MAAIAGVLACGAPEPAGRATVVVASGADLESANPLVTLHPMARQVQRYALFVTLARYDDALRPVPYFARSWSWSADRRVLTLTVFRGLRWHDGAPTTAHDVAFTIDAARDPATGYFRRADLGAITAVRVTSDTSVQVAFDAPQPVFPLVLCELPIAPSHLLAGVPRSALRDHPFGRAPVGNGPFRFVVRRPREAWTFDANREFPPALGGAPATDRLVVAVVDEATTKFAALSSGDVDVAGISPTMASLVSRDLRLRLVSYPVAFSNVLVFNVSRAPFEDVRVRRAVAAAIDRQRLVEVALSGFAEPADGPIPPGHPAASPDDTPPEAPDALLDAAGWSRGTDGWRERAGARLSFTLRSVGSGDNAMEQLIQADLRRVGIQVTLQQVELGTFLREARAPVKTFDAILTGIPGDLSLSHVAAMFEGAQSGGALDYAGFHHPGLDTLLRAARAGSDVAGWRAVAAWLEREAPVAWLYHSRGVQGLRARVEGVVMDLRGELVSVSNWRLRPPS